MKYETEIGVENVDKAYDFVMGKINLKDGTYEGFLHQVLLHYHYWGHSIVGINCNDRERKVVNGNACPRSYKFRESSLSHTIVGAR